MRILMLAPLCLVAACSGTEEEKKAEGPVAAAMGPGQWETTLETTAFRSTDGKTPVVTSTPGEKVTVLACIAPGEEAKPAPALFVGDAFPCSYTTSYIKEGRVNAQLSCDHDGTKGGVSMSVSGTSTADSFEGTVDANSFLPGDGDFAMSRKITSRRTGPTCQAPATKAV